MVRALTERRTVNRVKRHWLTIAFILGFVVDNITLNRVDQLFDNIILATYVVLAMVSLLMLYASAADKLPEWLSPKARKYSPLLTQYAFGGLLSGMLIFYGRSGDWSQSWPFLLLILSVIYGNETIRDRSKRLIFNLGVLFIGLFSYVVLLIPVVTGQMGPWVFVGSSLISLMIMYWFVRVLALIIPKFIALQIRSVVFTLGILFFTLNALYFTNIIPPIPLSLKDVGIYHGVVKFEGGTYQLTYAKPPRWAFWRNSDNTFYAEAGTNVFCFASVFAPTKLETDIFHTWEYWDETKEQWIEHNRLSYPIAGGRGGGFRGYTLVKSFTTGDWRCGVETERGQILGREEFTIVNGPAPNFIDRIE